LSAVRLSLLAALALALLSLLLPYHPVYDPWAWLQWGRELLDGGLETAAGPSWKPLPVFVDAPLSLLGDAAPAAWLAIARAGWICAPLLAGLLAARLSGAVEARWRLAGALLAGASVALTADSFTPALRQFTGGLSEPLLVALVLGAVWAALDERRGLALGLGAAASLLRPECWPFLAVWAWTLRDDPRLRAAALALAVLIPAAWFVPDLIAAGSPLEGSSTARAGGIEPIDAIEVLGRALAAPLAAAWAGLALLLALERGRLDRRLKILLLGALAWTLLVAAMAVAGWAGLPRFLAPATAVVAIAGGVGFARAGALASRGAPVWLAAAVAAAAVLALVGLGLRIGQLPGDLHAIKRQTRSLDDLFLLADKVGDERLLACGGVVRVTQVLPEPALAWKLDQPLGAVVYRRRPDHGVVLSVRQLPGQRPFERVGMWMATRLPCESG
jgi:hypothetical protein